MMKGSTGRGQAAPSEPRGLGGVGPISLPLNITLGRALFFSNLSTLPLVTLFLLQATIDGMIYKYKVFIAPGETKANCQQNLLRN